MMERTEPAVRIQLVGGQQVIASDDHAGFLRFCGHLFDRLIREVRHAGNLTRYVAYQSLLEDSASLHFLGIEVDEIRDVPEGMVGWDLGDRTWTIWKALDGRDVVLAQQEIAWQWRARSAPLGERCTGEFTACSLGEWIDGRARGPGEFWMSANAYVGSQQGLADADQVLLVEYDPAWPRQYREFAAWLRDRLGPEIALRVEHYGSTAIPGMPAKPVIDILVEIPSFAAARERVVPLFDDPLWEYWWYTDHMVLIKRDRFMGPRTHHVHLAPRGHRLWEGILFRDHLRGHLQDASRYEALKRALAAGYRGDREGYTDAKAAFVREILSKARDTGE